MPRPSEQLPIAYRGRRTAAGAVVEVRAPDGIWYALEPRLDLRDHSPTGFEWGYGDSGPAQLALALAATRLRDHEAIAIYQDLKRALVAQLDEDQWQFDAALLDELLTQLCAEAAGGDPGRGGGHDPV